MSVEIANRLMEGHCLSRIAKLTGMSVEGVRKWAKKYEKEGIIQRISKYPAMYRKTHRFQPSLKPVGDFNHTPTMLPKKFGAICALIGRPPLQYDRYGKAYAKDSEGDNYTHIIQFGRKKAQIWLKSGFVGTTPEELMENGRRQLEALATRYSQEYGVQLTILRIYDDIEWVVISRKTSSSIAKSAHIPKGGAIEVAGAIHKYGDFSDPNNVQFNAKPHGEPKKPSEQSIIHHFVYSGEMGRTLEAIGDGIISMNQRLIRLEQKK